MCYVLLNFVFFEVEILYCMDADTEARLLESSTQSPPAVNYGTKPVLASEQLGNTPDSSTVTPNSSTVTENNSVPTGIHELDANRSTQELDGRPVQRHPSCLRIGHPIPNNNTGFMEDFFGPFEQQGFAAPHHTGNTPELDVDRPRTPELDGREVYCPRHVDSFESTSDAIAGSMDVNTSKDGIEEISIKKIGLTGKVWLGFKNLDNKLDNIYVKYHALAKRKLY